MKTFRKLHRESAKAPLPAMYHLVLGNLERVLGNGPQDPSLYEEPCNYAEKYLCHNLRRKIVSPFNQEVDEKARRSETLTKFLLRETVNEKINQTETFGYDPATGVFASDLLGYQILYRAREIIHEICGTMNLSEVLANASFGNGASATLVRADAQSAKKFCAKLSVTSGLHDLMLKFIESCPMWSEVQSPKEILYFDTRGNGCLPPGHLKRLAGAVMDFVPKTAKIDRIILKEPELNGFIQKGIGEVLRGRLRKYTKFAPDGMNLNTSGDLNNGLAKAGSLHGHIATVDGEQASDSLTLALFEFAFPEDWYRVFLAARSPYVVLPNGRLHRLSMMSGMGNGFTFEAESIIFYAIGCACAERSNLPFAEQYVSVHGDDLTVPTDVYADVVAAYTAAGIVVNESKSFSEGPFRESCGGHYFCGHSVKPFYVKKQTGLTRGDWCWLANSLLLWLQDRSTSYLSSGKGQDLLQILWFLRWYSSSGNISHWSTAIDRSRRSGIFTEAPKLHGRYWKTRNVVDVPRKEKFEDDQAYLDWLCVPKNSPSVAELLAHKAPSSDPYAYTATTDERERWVTIYEWPSVHHAAVVSPLWRQLQLHNQPT